MPLQNKNLEEPEFERVEDKVNSNDFYGSLYVEEIGIIGCPECLGHFGQLL